jgi:hypothetical protein
MGRFIFGLIIGFAAGVIVMAYNPGFAERVEEAATEITETVLRGTEEVADTVGRAAGRGADEVERTNEAPPVEEPAQ